MKQSPRKVRRLEDPPKVKELVNINVPVRWELHQRVRQASVRLGMPLTDLVPHLLALGLQQGEASPATPESR